MARFRAASRARGLLLAALVALPGGAAVAQTVGWLDFDRKILGESIDRGHEGWIDILGFGFGSSREIEASAGAVDRSGGRPDVAEVTLTKFTDRATPKLFAAATIGTVYPEVTLDLVLPGDTPDVRIELHDVLVSSFSVGGAAGEARPTESISLNFTKITFFYPISPSESLFTTYDLANDTAQTGTVPNGPTEPPNPDSDGDGLPDAWEITHGLRVGVNDAADDKDGDGLTNLDEFQLGTHPGSGSSFFKATLTPQAATPGSYQITWNSVAGKTYIIEWSPDLVTPFAPLRTVTATAASTTESLVNGAGLGFYRVRPQ